MTSTAPERHPPLLTWTRHSFYLLSAFLLTIGLIIYIWWPLAEEYLAYIDWNGKWWQNFDWLLVGIFLVMSVLIVTRADLHKDGLTIFIGAFGGLIIEAWGTQTNLWFYYTAERPPLWIIPAWPIAAISIDRLRYFLDRLTPRVRSTSVFIILYWLVFGSFYTLMLVFVSPTFTQPYSLLAAALCAVLILTPPDKRLSVLTFAAGSGLGYFLELWGTTRQCWTYYTYQTPPLFAVLAHGMAAVAFWRTGLLIQPILHRLRLRR